LQSNSDKLSPWLHCSYVVLYVPTLRKKKKKFKATKLPIHVENSNMQRVKIQILTGRSDNMYYLAENKSLNC